jgi:hypothetical protein
MYRTLCYQSKTRRLNWNWLGSQTEGIFSAPNMFTLAIETVDSLGLGDI